MRDYLVTQRPTIGMGDVLRVWVGVFRAENAQQAIHAFVEARDFSFGRHDGYCKPEARAVARGKAIPL